jgi:hypothetical protein
LRAEGKVSEGTHDFNKRRLEKKIADANAKIDKLHVSDSSLIELQDRQSRIFLLESRKAFVAKLVKEGNLKEESAYHLYVDIDAELDSIINESDPVTVPMPEEHESGPL